MTTITMKPITITEPMTCKGPECDRPSKTKGLCNTHYLQLHRGAPLTPIRKRGGRQSPICTFEGCDKKSASESLCSGHYSQKTRGGELRPLRTPAQIRDEENRKKCATCSEWKPESDYQTNTTKTDGLSSSCRECINNSYVRRRESMRFRRFNITEAEYEAMLVVQGGKCATCGTDEPGLSDWCIDHDHACCPERGRSCGKCVRGILCRSCNLALGIVQDNIETLARMAEYLKTTSVTAPVAAS